MTDDPERAEVVAQFAGLQGMSEAMRMPIIVPPVFYAALRELCERVNMPMPAFVIEQTVIPTD